MKQVIVCILFLVYTCTIQAQIGNFQKVYTDSVFSKDYRFKSLPNYSLYNGVTNIISPTTGTYDLTTPPGTTAQRPTVPAGKYILRYNTDSSALEIGNPSQVWKTLSMSSVQTLDTSSISNFGIKVRSLFTATTPLQYDAVTGNIAIPAATSSVSGYLASADWVVFNSKLPDPGSNGLVARTASGTTASRQLVAASTNVSIVNANGVSGNPSIDLNDTLSLSQLILSKIPASAPYADSAVTLNRTTGLLEIKPVPSSGGSADTSVLATLHDLSLVNNGLSRNNDTTQLGQTIGASGSPAALRHSTEIPLNGFNTVFTGTGSIGIGTSSPSSSIKLTVTASGSNGGISVSSGSGIAINASTTGNAIVGQSTGGSSIGISGSTSGGGGYGVQGSGGIGGIGGRFYTIAAGGDASPVSLELERLPTGIGVSNGAGFTILFKNAFTNGVTGNESGRITNYFSNAVSGAQTSAFGFHLVNSAVSARKALLNGNGQWTWDDYGSSTFQTSDTSYNALVVDGSGNIFKRSGSNSSTGLTGGLNYIYSATALTGVDTSKIWVKTPDIAGVYDVYHYVTGATGSWQRFGWLSIDGIFSFKRPITIAMCGQSNAAGIADGGDTSWLPGIIAFGSPAGDGTSTDYQYEWHQARINKSPFYSSHNNIAFQFAKRLKRNNDADIVRVITTYEGGTNLDLWINGANGHVLLDTFRNRLNRSGIDTIDAFLWHQGESGGVTGFTLGGYVVDQRVFYDTLCSPLTKGFFRNYTRYIAGGLFEGAPFVNINRGSPQAAQEGLNYDGNLYTGFASARGLGTIDGIHFSATGIDTFGIRYHSVFKSLPHNTYEELQPFTWDQTYDLQTEDATVTRILDYNGGPGATKKVGAGFRYADNSNNTVLSIMQGPNSVRVGAAYGSASRSFSVLGTTSILEGNYNLNISTDYNPSGSPEHCTFITNHSSNFTLSGSNDAVIIGYNAGAATNHQPGNSVIVGSEAFYNSTPSGFGDIVTGVGWQAGHGSAGLGLTFVGGRAGKNAAGSYLTALGMDAGATATTGWTNSTAVGANAKWDGDSVLVLGAALKRVYFGGNGTTIKFKTDVAPSNGQVWTYNSTSGLVEFATPAGATTIYTGDGTLPTDRNIASGGFTLRLSGANNSDTLMSIVNTGTSSVGLFSLGSLYGVDAQSTTIGLRAFGTSTGLTATGDNSEGAVIASNSIRGAKISSTPSSTNTVQEVLRLDRATTGTAANGIGGSMDMIAEDASNTASTANQIIWKWTDATNKTSQFSITGVNSGTTASLFELEGNGALKLNKYGIGTFTGTIVNYIGATSSGSLVEQAASTIPLISSGTTAPATTPGKVGDIYVDTSNKKLYFATGTSSSSDWTIAN